jgi:hypothetical protein
MYYPKSKVIFPHIPKTGGSSLEYFIGQIEHPEIFRRKKMQVGNKMTFLNEIYRLYSLEPENKRWNIHRWAIKYLDHLGEDYDSYYSFSFIRNPFSQVKSLYTMNKEYADKKDKPYPTWEEYIWTDNLKIGLIRSSIYLDQKGFVSDKEGNILVNELFPFEYYKECVGLLARKLKFTPDFNVRLWSTKPEYEFNPDMVERVMDLYGDSYELWKKVKNFWEVNNRPYEGRKKSSTGNTGKNELNKGS